MNRFLTATAAAAVAAIAVPSLALAHLERPSYWPDPGPDTSVRPPAGGQVPKARSLGSAVTGKGPGEVRVVCERGKASLRLAFRSIRRSEARGFKLRPSQSKDKLSEARGDKLREINQALIKQCEYRHIQDAVNDSRNNDRVVIMPGRYTEPTSRKSPLNDPKCNPGLLQEDQSGALTPSYEYQATCPNDQNLVHVQGRKVVGEPLAEPDPDRHGIPEQELGRCVRCNLQIEGSGPRPENVIIDGGKGYDNPKRPQAQPADFAKHVVMRTDRSDGFVGRNFLLRGAAEHGFYTEETDGVLLNKVKFFWGADYGHLSFTTDHNMIKNCEGIGAGDAAVYPGASPQTGEFRDQGFYPEERRNTVIKKCDLHGNVMAYSGSMGNSVRVTRNHIYGNINGITSDTISAPGHPGFPADGMEIDNNFIYSNNLNLYTPDPPFEPFIPMPIGTGIVWPGMNDGEIHDNWIFDNWRHGTVLIAVPDAVAGEADGNLDPDIHCDATGPPAGIASTSCDNHYFDNRMGQVPPGFKPPGMKALTKFGNVTGLGGGGSQRPNGVDFWWDEFPGNDGNCWFDNTGPDGTRASLTGDPEIGPTPDVSLPGFLPEDCGTSVGAGDPVKEAILVDCVMWSRGDTAEDHPLCYWFQMPSQPGSRKAKQDQREYERAAAAYEASEEGAALAERLEELGGQTTFANRP